MTLVSSAVCLIDLNMLRLHFMKESSKNQLYGRFNGIGVMVFSRKVQLLVLMVLLVLMNLGKRRSFTKS